MDTKVLYYGREALLSSYFDTACLKFYKSEGRPFFPDEAIHEYSDLPDVYVVYLGSVSIPDRKRMEYLDGTNKCFCARLGKIDSPKRMAEEKIVEMIGEDPLEYDAGDFANPGKYAKVKCTTCGCQYRVNIKSGYRTSYYNWEQI